MVVKDHCSRRLGVTALEKAEATDIKEVLREKGISHRDVRRPVLSDNGPELVAETLHRLCRSNGERKVFRHDVRSEKESAVKVSLVLWRRH